MKNLLILLAALFTTSSFAVGIGNDNPPGAGGGAQIQGQAQGQGQAQFSNADSRSRAQAYIAALTRSEANNSQSLSVTPAPVTLTVNEAAIPAYQKLDQGGTLTIRQAPQIYAPNAMPTAPCRIALSGGVSVVQIGITAGGSVADLKCNWRENDRMCQSSGDIECSRMWQKAIARLECLEAGGDEKIALAAICETVLPK